MAIANPVFISVLAGQDASVTVRLSSSENVADWTVEATVRAYHGQTAIATKTIANGGVAIADEGNGVWTITFTDTELSITPGSYVFEFRRTNDGYEYPICDPSAFIVRSEASATTPTMTNLSEYIAWRKRDLTISDADAWQAILALGVAEETIRCECGRDFVYASYTEYPESTGLPYFTVREVINSITSLYFDADARFGQASNAYESADLLTSGDDYYFVKDQSNGLGNNGRVYRVGANWPAQRRREYGTLTTFQEPLLGAIKITYVGGYTIIPYDLKSLVWDVATLVLSAAEHGRPFNSENFEDYGYSLMSFADDALRVASVKSRLNSYRHGATFFR